MHTDFEGVMRMRRRLRPDGALIVRMVLAMVLLGVVYAIFLAVLARVGVGLSGLVVIAIGMALVQFFFSDKLVLMSMRARVVSPSQAPELHAIVGRLAASAQLPMPRVAVSDMPVPNAFATGRGPRHAVVCVTQGLLGRLNSEELEAVLAHEITHVKNRDMAVITFISFFSTAAALIVQNAFWIFGFGGFGGGFGGGRRRNDDIVLAYLVSVLVWVVSFFLIRAVSRYREYAADRGSAILTGQPSQLMSALVKISDTAVRIPTKDLRQMESLSAFMIVPALTQDSIQELLSTHPSIEHRLARLRAIEAQMR
jgi:heat shock protein HtpX